MENQLAIELLKQFIHAKYRIYCLNSFLLS